MDFEKKLEAYYELESESRRDLHGNVISDNIYVADEDCYGLCDFLSSLDEPSPLKCGELLANTGDEEGNHNQLDYMRDHIMPYLVRDFSKHAGFFESMTKLITLAADRTSYWGDFDEEEPDKEYANFNANYDKETTALCEDMESYSKEWEEICKDVKEYIEGLVNERVGKTHKRDRTASPSPQPSSDDQPQKKAKKVQYTVEDVKKALYAEDFGKYKEMKKMILKKLEECRQMVTALEMEHIVDEDHLGVKDFLETCDEYVEAVTRQSKDDSDDEDDEENEKDFEEAEMTLNECTVPSEVWTALF